MFKIYLTVIFAGLFANAASALDCLPTYIHHVPGDGQTDIPTNVMPVFRGIPDTPLAVFETNTDTQVAGDAVAGNGAIHWVLENELSPNTQYDVRQYNEETEEWLQEWIEDYDFEGLAFTTGAEPDNEAPPAPQLASATRDDNEEDDLIFQQDTAIISLVFESLTDPDWAWYEIEYSEDASFSESTVISKLNGTSLKSGYCDSDVSTATVKSIAFVRIRARDLAGNVSEYSNTIEVVDEAGESADGGVANSGVNSDEEAGGCSCSSSDSFHGKGGLGLLGLFLLVRRRKKNT